MKVLIVEDNASHLWLAKFTFSKLNESVEFVEAMDGEAAIDVAQRELPDLILLDLRLPKIDGGEVLKCLKENPRTKRIPVIMLTTSDNETDVIHAYDHYVSAYLVKPIGLDKLKEVIKRIDGLFGSIHIRFAPKC